MFQLASVRALGVLPNPASLNSQRLIPKIPLDAHHNFRLNLNPRKRDYVWPDNSCVQKKSLSKPLKHVSKIGKNGSEIKFSRFPLCKRGLSMSESYAQDLKSEKDNEFVSKAMLNTQVEKHKLEKQTSDGSCKSSNSIESNLSSKKEIQNKSKTFSLANSCFSDQNFTFRAEINSRPLDLTLVEYIIIFF